MQARLRNPILIMSEEQAKQSGRSGCWVALIVLILASTALLWKAWDDIIDFIKPGIEDVTITMTERGEEIFEFNSYEKDVIAIKHMENTSWGSTWKIDYSQKFKAKYGMHVSEHAGADNVLTVRYEIIVTSLEPIGEPTIKSENGWWNNISDQDRASIINAVKDAARIQAMQDNAAVTIAEQRLRAFLENRYAGKQATFQRN